MLAVAWCAVALSALAQLPRERLAVAPGEATQALAAAIRREVGEQALGADPADPQSLLLRAEWSEGALLVRLSRGEEPLLERRVEPGGDRAAMLRAAALIVAEALPRIQVRTSTVARARTPTVAVAAVEAPPPILAPRTATAAAPARPAGWIYRGAGGVTAWSTPQTLVSTFEAGAALRLGALELGGVALVALPGHVASGDVDGRTLTAALLASARARAASTGRLGLWLQLGAGPALERVKGTLTAYAAPSPLEESGLTLLVRAAASVEWSPAPGWALELGAGAWVRAVRFTVNLPGPFARTDPPLDPGLLNPWLFLAIHLQPGAE